MRKFFPRLFNIICFVGALALIVPWTNVGSILNMLSNKYQFLSFLNYVGDFLLKYSSLKLLIIPLSMIAISLFYFILATIDRGIKKHQKKTTFPFANMTFAPLYLLVFAGTSSLLLRFVFVGDLKFKDTDYFGLGKFLTGIDFTNNLRPLYLAFFFLGIFIFTLIFALFLFRKNRKRGFFGRFIPWLLFLIFAVLSYKGISDNFSESPKFMELLTLSSEAKEVGFIVTRTNLPTFLQNNHFYTYPIYIFVIVTFILYIIIGISRIKKNNKVMKEEKLNAKNLVENNIDNKDENQAQEDNKDLIDNNVYKVPETSVSDSLFVQPNTEEVIETEVTEKTVIKQVVYEDYDLNQIYGTDFDFKNCTMIKKDGTTDYFVNKVKFLTLSNKNRTMSFRLELDKAIRLIIQYPLIGKDKYENHKIWFKIDDASILSKEVLINIIKDAYNAVLNNE